MDYPKLIVSNQKEESITIQRLKCLLMKILYEFYRGMLVTNHDKTFLNWKVFFVFLP